MSTILPSSTDCWLGVFSLSTKKESINSHLFLSILGFAIRHQTCFSTFMLRQLVAGREEENFMEEVSSEYLGWKNIGYLVFSGGEEKRNTYSLCGQKRRILQYRWQAYLGEQVAELRRESTDVQALIQTSELSLRQQSKDSTLPFSKVYSPGLLITCWIKFIYHTMHVVLWRWPRSLKRLSIRL